MMTKELPFDPATEPYVSMVTFRRSGAEVATPVWIAELAGRYYLFSEARAGKVKRIKNNPRTKLAACNYRGKVSSPWLEATSRVVSDADLIANARQALRKKYGWQVRLGDFLATLSGRINRRAYIEISLV